ncbi:phosphatidylglycerol lysyltransferase domain-containing protein [Nocardioides sp. CER19]|uniref:phosphatidylglycerol lysyltransferase domain-containing protein n=1 Tax=Nocardioides sp. CER19 TaxID=3038538 RepID=UPI00244712F3|nr:phosphatidylglycerol lysyltransferase domain-containing protein [Nocardioides sp. CER19]MDH2416486.1 phosphatidylglycerol lysyltransferase domain-containing protein [Nocardioides sp. CER19]
MTALSPEAGHRENSLARATRRRARHRVPRALAALGTPKTISRLVWLVGVVAVISAASPAFHSRVLLVTGTVPPVFPAAATTGTLAAGVVLMLLATGLRRGKYRAWLLATVLTAFATIAHLVKGLDVEEATLTASVFALLVSARHRFRARPDPRSPRRIAAVVVLGIPLAAFLGFVWISVDLDGLAPSTTVHAKLTEAFLGLVGVPGPVSFVEPGMAARTSAGLAVLGAALVLLLVVVALQPAAGPHRLDLAEREGVRSLLGRWGAVDSLSWFALREDRAVIFSPSRKAAVSYRIVGGVSLAAGDPLGDPEAWPGAIAAWLQEADSYGWRPAVLGASEQGAEAYYRAGLDALELGDEAVLQTADFTTEGRRMRVVRQAVTRCRRAGLSTTCNRVGDLDEATRSALLASAEAWRDGEVERGFSMALGRLADPEDGDAVVVLCRDASGRLRGLLQLVPWGDDGLSLDVMRRDRSSENGIIELMVADLMAQAPALGVARVSLNFAVFRHVFARGERLGAGPVLRLWRAILVQASRFWQIESLYRANAKFQPEWVPRFVCFRAVGDLPSVSVAVLRAEAFLVAPAWWRNLGQRARERGSVDGVA